MKNKKKRILVIIGIIIVFAIIAVLIFPKIKNIIIKPKAVNPPAFSQEAVDSMATSLKSELATTPATATDRELIKRNNPGPTLEIGNGAITPKSFLVEYPSEVSLAVISSDNQAHELVFTDQEGKKAIKVGPNETQIAVFKAPAPGRYILNCDLSSHAGKNETGEMIVSIKAKSSGVLKDEKKIPGASLVINNGLIQPEAFSVAAKEPISLTFISEDSRAHNIIFSDPALKISAFKITAGSKKTSVFNAPKEPGTYEFHCAVSGHEAEKGTIIVK